MSANWSDRCGHGIPMGPFLRGMYICKLRPNHEGPHQHKPVEGHDEQCELIVNGSFECRCSVLRPEPTYKKYVVDYGYLCQVVDHCTCGTGRGGYYGAHESGCGLDPIAPVDQLVTAVTAEDVYDAMLEWSGHAIGEQMAYPGAMCAFIADYLNKRTATAPDHDPGTAPAEQTTGEGT